MTEFAYVVFLLLFLFVFMYQRTTLTIARILKAPSISDVQLALTPTWIGLLGWVSWGIYVACFLIGIKYGILIGIVSLIFVHVLSSFVPIPSDYFFNLVEKHLKWEFILSTNNYEADKANAIEKLLAVVRKVKQDYTVR